MRSARARIAVTLAIALTLTLTLTVTYAGVEARFRRSAQTPSSAEAGARVRVTRAVEPVIDALWKSYDQAAAMDHVRFMSQYWRLAGNTGYNATVDRIQKRLDAAGIKTTIDEYPNGGPAWDYSTGTLALVTDGKPDQVVLSREQDGVALCINSFSTSADGVVAPLVDVGRGTDQDFAGKNVKGAVVLGDADAGALWRRAVTTGGALGVISTSLPAYLNADPPGVKTPTPRDQWGILQWGSVPYDDARKAFGFKASPRAAAALRRRLTAAGGAPVSVRVTIASTFTAGPVRTLVAEIPGRSAAAERIVMAAHIQEPGANDNASGAGTLAEAAVSMAAAIRAKAVAPPERTLTFLFLNEISGSRRWLQDHPAEAKQVRYMFSLDMTGEDVAKTGGSFLVERYPDPGAVWTRPWDPHTEWGAGNVRADSLKGDLINDAHLFVIQQVARRSNWVVKTNPYEGGSDHTVFQSAGIPSVLDWHFTDRYYHTNLDTPDKTSPQEMRNVGVSVAASAWLFASATPAIATDIARIVAEAGRSRIAQEQTEGGKLAAAAADPTAARARETTIVAAWKKWYAEAVRSASRLVVGTAPESFSKELDTIAAEFQATAGENRNPVSVFPAALSASLLGLLPPFTIPVIAQSPEAIGIFTCGVDQVVAPITVNWPAMVLIGDGRIYVPCPRRSMLDPPHPTNHRENRERTALNLGQNSNSPDVRWRAAQALVRISGMANLMRGTTPAPSAGPLPTYYGSGIELDSTLGMVQRRPLPAIWVPVCLAEVQHFGTFDQLRRWQAGPLFQFLLDDNPEIRKEAAYAIGTRLATENLEADLVNGAVKELRACWLKQSDPAVQGVILATVGVIRYANEQQRQDAEAFLVKESQGSNVKVLGAVSGLEAMIRRSPQPGPSEATKARLRRLVSFGNRVTEPSILDTDSRIRRLALAALMTARDNDMDTFRAAVADDDWQMRRLIASRINILTDAHAPIAELLAVDPEFQVRYDFLSSIGRWSTTTKVCAPLVDRFKDPSPFVIMRAMDLVSPNCTDLEDTVKALLEHADKLMKPEELLSWHVPSRALTALARLSADDARPLFAAAMKHPAWQVRAAVASAGATIQDEGLPVSLMEDPEPNVRTAALEALGRMKSAAVFPHALATLRTATDYQLLHSAAGALRNLPADAKEEASGALLFALNKLTEQGTDTSRDPRVAILERLAEVLAPERSSDLLQYLFDYDDAVGRAAAKSFETLVGTPPADGAKRRRYPYQPTIDQLSKLPTEAVIQLESGFVTLRLLTDVAPVTVARFAELAARGFYNDRTFHRIVPNFVVQGGSPGANEYVGASRFMRDEVGPQASHVRGAVGISSRGVDTGDGQIFIDLVDLPRLDRDYTVFAYVVKGMELVDQMLDGAKILSVTVK